MTSWMRDAFACTTVEPAAAAQTAVTAGGAGDATEVNGKTLDRTLFTNVTESLAAIVFGVTTLAAAETLTIAANWEEADSDFATNKRDVPDADVIAATVVRTGAATAKGFFAILPLNLQLVTKNFIRVVWTPNLSRAGTDTATVMSSYLFAAPQESPAARTGPGIVA